LSFTFLCFFCVVNNSRPPSRNNKPAASSLHRDSYIKIPNTDAFDTNAIIIYLRIAPSGPRSLVTSFQPQKRRPHSLPTGLRPSTTSILPRESQPGTSLPSRWRIPMKKGANRSRRWIPSHALPRLPRRTRPCTIVLRSRIFLAFPAYLHSHHSRLRTILPN